MVLSTEPAFDVLDFDPDGAFLREYEDVTVYGDADGDVVLHEGPARLLGNGWIELSTGRLFSPDAVHHVDPEPTDA